MSHAARHRTLGAWSLLTALVLAGLATASEPADSQPLDTADFHWLSGCWQSPDQSSEEWWSRQASGHLMGAGRTFGNGRLRSFEWMQIIKGERGWLLRASPGGGASTDFMLTRVGSDWAVFENPAHDFPTRISYHRGRTEQGEQQLTARASGLDGNGPEWVLRAQPCR